MRRVAIALAGAIAGGAAGMYAVSSPRKPADETSRQPTVVVTREPADENPQQASGSARRPPPRFNVAPGDRQVETDPSKQGYDPTKLSHIGVPLADIVAAEPRVPVWAAPMEKMLSSRIAEDLAHFSSGARVAEVDCRSNSCLIKVDAPEADVNDVHLALQLVRPGDVFSSPKMESSNEKGMRRLIVPVLFANHSHDLQTAARLQSERRKAALKQLRDDPTILSKAGVDPKKLPPLEP